MPRQRLPNAPLVEVSCEIRFHGALSVLTKGSAFQKDIQEQFPRLLVPGAVPGTSPLLQHVRFATADDTTFVMLAVNSFGISTRAYDEFADFKKSWADLLSVFVTHFGDVRMTRFGLRYQNVLPRAFPGPPSTGRIHPCLRMELSSLGFSHEGLSGGQFSFELARDWGKVRISLVPQEVNIPQMVLTQPDGSRVVVPSPEATKLDLDAFVEDGCELASVGPLLDKAHDAIDEVFFGLITDEYLQYLKGE